jgi:serine phosphatase RsbU (regulator of sigma subunit)
MCLALEELGYSIQRLLDGGLGLVGQGAVGLVLVDAGESQGQALDACRRLRPLLLDPFIPILAACSPSDTLARQALLEAGADACLVRPFTPGELKAQVASLARVKAIHDRLAAKAQEAARLNGRLQQAYQQIDQELELARRLHASFLPQSLPQVANTRFAAHYLPCGRVGGDFYDVFRLDEQHVGMYVADAMGHGVPASLLSIFVKKGVRPKEVFGNRYRILPPNEVLTRLNRELIEQRLSNHPFITMAYAILNTHDGTLRVSRAGHPYPVYIPARDDVTAWKPDGLLLGLTDAQFGCMTHPLAPGDKLLLYTDGIDQAQVAGSAQGMESLLECARRLRHLPVEEMVPQMARALCSSGQAADDLTLLAVERAP